MKSMKNIKKQTVVWKIYPEYPFIEVNQFGEIRTKDRIVRGKGGYKYHIKGRILKQYDNRRGRGYLFVNVNVNGKQFHLYVHRAVATCFIPNPENLPEVNHIDNNPKNNIVSNLEWCTHEYNTEYREKYGIPAKEFSKVLRKPVIAINLESFKVFWFESQNEAAHQLDVNQGRISDVINGKLNKTHGYWFCRANVDAVKNTRVKFGDEVANKVEEIISGKIWCRAKTKNKQ